MNWNAVGLILMLIGCGSLTIHFMMWLASISVLMGFVGVGGFVLISVVVSLIAVKCDTPSNHNFYG